MKALILTATLALGPEAGAAQDLPVLRAEALQEVNADRQAAGKAPLEADRALDAAAQAHAEDMLARDYYDHVSPDGDTVRDRADRQGIGPASLVAENIAECRGCPTPPDRGRVAGFQSGWMQSPGHRENILSPGLARFGFGIAAEAGRTVAVQTFSGPGTPRGRTGGSPRATRPNGGGPSGQSNWRRRGPGCRAIRTSSVSMPPHRSRRRA